MREARHLAAKSPAAHRAIAHQAKIRKARNRTESARILAERGVPFISMDDGAHLMMTIRGEQVDFYPGTGAWINRTTNAQGRGVFKLLRAFGV